MAIFTGTINAETLTGDIGNDDMFGDAGNDTLVGAVGNDTLDGGLGADSMVGGVGNDIYIVDDIGDVVVEVPTEGIDVVLSSITYTLSDDVDQLVLTGALAINGTGNTLGNLLTGNDAANVLTGDAGNDTLLGAGGNDKLDGGLDADSMAGGLGDDTYVADNAGDVVVEATGEGYDLLTTKTTYTLAAGVEVEEITLFNDTVQGSTFDHNFGITANEFNNIITGNKGDNVIDAGAGNDTIDTTAGGADTITLGAGNDSVVLSLIGPVVLTDFNPAEDRLDLGTVLRELTDTTALAYDNPFTKGYLQMIASGADTLVQVNDQTGSGWQTIATLQGVAPAALTVDNFRYNLDPAGHAAAVTLTGTIGNDILEGWDGNDTITGDAGNDLLDGGFGGNDSISGGDGADTIFGFGGNDTLEGGANGDFIYGGSGNDLILGGDGEDRSAEITYKGYTYTYANIALEGGDGNDTVDGGANNDNISGGHGDDSLIGGSGDDYLVDAAGNDTMLGGDGADTLNDNGDGGVMFGEAGNDELTLDLDTFYGGKAVASLLDGGADDDLLKVLTNASGSVLHGGTGNDTIYAYSSGLNRVVVDGGAGNDNITNSGISNSAWTIVGGEGDDRIEMGGDFHLIDAGAGNDTIDFEVAIGKTGSGTVTTGAGIDVIELSLRAVVEDGHVAMVVTDFQAGTGGDKFDLGSVISKLGLPVGTDPFAGGYLRLVASGTSTYVEATTAPGAAAVYTTMAVLQGVTPGSLKADNFVQAVIPVVSTNQGPVVDLPHVVALQGSGATSLGITAPTDPEGGALAIYLDYVPDKDTQGSINLSNGTQVYASVSNPLTAENLAGLTFTPVAGATGDGAALFYTVTDDAGNKIRTAILLETPNIAPTVNVTDQVYTANGATPFSYDLKTVVSDTQTSDNLLTYAVTVNGGALPAWLNYDPLTHVLSGTPPVNTDVAYTISVSVTDLKGVATVGTFMLTPPGLTVDGTTGDDSLTGHAGHDVLNGLLGNDTLDGAGGKDTMAGGAGNDTYIVDSTAEVIVENGGEGTDTILASVSYVLVANIENLSLTSTTGMSATGNSQANMITGNIGNDTINGGAGNDTMIGGAGNDVYYRDAVGDVITETAGNGTDTVISSLNCTLGANLENLTLSGTALNGAGNELNNVMVGTAGNNLLWSYAGNDSVLGGEGNDSIDGGVGNDTMLGGVGNDTYYRDAAGDMVIEQVGEGVDTVISSANWTMSANVENLTLTGAALNAAGNELDNGIAGTAGNNLIWAYAGNDTILAGAGNDSVDGGDGNDSVDGGVGNDSLAGGLGNDSLVGGAGNDTLAGGAGNDTMVGGADNDTYHRDSAGDVLTEGVGEGTDMVISSVNYTLGANLENLTLTGTALNAAGNELANIMTGTAGNNLLWAYAGNDTIDAGAGNDTIDGGDGNDSLLGGAGSDSVVGGTGDDTLDGGLGNDTMVGGTGNDLYMRNSASDVLTEGAGAGTDTVISSLNYTLGANLENLTLTSTALNAAGNELANVMTGTAGNNLLWAYAGNDTIDAGAGNDTMSGGVGNDTFVFSSALNAATNVDVISDFAAGDVMALDNDVFTALGAAGTLAVGQFHAGAGLTGSASDLDGAGIYYDTTAGALYYDADGFGGSAAVKFATLTGAPGLNSASFLIQE
jgi:Ca2+-binding RTX toxin-like protein